MKLRKLILEDAPLMLEWMHDWEVVHFLKTDFCKKTLEDCKCFILNSQDTENDMHLAVVDDTNEYMGTVSLKHQSKEKSCAEFAITMRTKAMGKGFAAFGMREIIRIAHEERNIANVVWCVSEKNEKAVRFYDKNGYYRVAMCEIPAYILGEYREEGLLWYRG